MRGLLVLFLTGLLAAQSDPSADAVEALQRGDVAAAERILRPALRSHPRDADVLGVLAVVLDREQKYAEAEQVYRQALALPAPPAALFNNYGNHLLAMHHMEAAREAFAKAVALAPAHANARLQLARIAVAQKQPELALRQLKALAQPGVDAEIVRMEALFQLHRAEEAQAILARVADSAGPQQLGAGLAAAGEYARAEEQFSRALESDPRNFELLYQLGLAASHAGHDQRARDILESALREQPANVDVMYDVAAVYARLGQGEDAVRLLAQASRAEPERRDVLELLARTTAELGYFGDAIAAWDRYLKLNPRDETAARERAFAASAIGEHMEQALSRLREFVARHPQDAVGRYELGVAEAAADPDDAWRQFQRALALQPDLPAVRLARGLLLFKRGQFAAALLDFEAARKREPDNPVVLDRLGQCYLALDRVADAVPVLRRAAEVAPRDAKTLLHLGRALTAAGQADEARQVFARFRELGPDKSALPHPAGLVDFLGLSSAEQTAHYRAGVERTVHNDPRNTEAQVRYLKLLLADGRTAEAAAVAQDLLKLEASPALLAEAGKALLDAGQYAQAMQVLERTGEAHLLDLAIATGHAKDPPSGLTILERMPANRRDGDFFLAQAQMLDAAGQTNAAAAALNRALETSPSRPDLYLYAGSYLIQNGRAGDALSLLERASRKFPDSAELSLQRAAALVAVDRIMEAAALVNATAARSPDWYGVWLARAIFAAWQGKPEEAGRLRDFAAALGAEQAETSWRSAVDATAPAERALRLLHAVFH